jgi:very-short-patch-repair endonuclease
MPSAPRPPTKQLREQLVQAAREMRRDPTLAEKTLWERIRNCQLAGCKFRRRHTIDRFVADFYCAQRNLVIEVDGPIHNTQQAQDAERQTILETLGLRVLRFTNDEILNDIDSVVARILVELQE